MHEIVRISVADGHVSGHARRHARRRSRDCAVWEKPRGKDGPARRLRALLTLTEDVPVAQMPAYLWTPMIYLQIQWIIGYSEIRPLWPPPQLHTPNHPHFVHF